MLAIRISGTKLKTARQLVGWSRDTAAIRSSVNWLTVRGHLPGAVSDFRGLCVAEGLAAGSGSGIYRMTLKDRQLILVAID
jgi:hypothetical protein